MLFTDFAVDGVSSEASDASRSAVKFMGGSHDYISGVDNKHCIQNDRCQLIGGSNAAAVGNNFIDVDLLAQSEA